MRTWALLGVAALLQLAGHASGAVVEFKKTLLAAESKAASHISFSTVESTPLKQNVLMTMDGYYSTADRVACSVTETKVNSGKVTVLLAISNCLNQSSIDLIEDWVTTIKQEKLSYFQDEQEVDLDFATTLVPGQCQARSEKTTHGLEDATWQNGEEMLADDAKALLASNAERIAGFAKFGRVLYAAPTDEADIPVAVISFSNNAASFDLVDQYERTFKISNTFNFQICEDGVSCEGRFKNCVFLEEGVDLFMYNPFTVVRSFECADLTDALPVSYVDEQGERQCFCSCPAGFEQLEDNYGHKYCHKVEPETCPCTWSTHPFGFKHANKFNLDVCTYDDIASDWGVPVPFPSDNYVADKRVNRDDGEYDSVEDGPHISVVVTPQYSPIYDDATLVRLLQLVTGGVAIPETFPPSMAAMLDLISGGDLETIVSVYNPSTPTGPPTTVHYTWRDYQAFSKNKIDALTFTAYGKYLLNVQAYDYTDDADCPGCVAIVDDFRPRATTQCPASFCDNTTSVCGGAEPATAELTPANRARAAALVDQVYEYQTAATNDACSSERCDLEMFKLKEFFDDSYVEKAYAQGATCFDGQELAPAFLTHAQATENPLVRQSYGQTVVKQDTTPVPPGLCTRCCKYETKLREFWTDYTCGYDYDVRRCSGLESETCGFQQCLVLNGDTVATVRARIKTAVAAESQAVLDGLVQEGYQVVTQVHRTLQCTSLGGDDGECTWTASISDLIETETTPNYELPEYVSVHDYVFWRYRVENDENGWRLWDATDAYTSHTFTEAETKITIEAWTQCGRVRKFYFYVHLHPNSDIQVCEYFDAMWYQTSVSRLPIVDELCAYPGSDFAELTFDYHPDAGLQYARNSSRMHTSHVVCQLAYDGRSAMEILNVEASSPQIVDRFAVELMHLAETEPKTAFKVSCAFTYKRADETTTTQTCERDFVIKDCHAPGIDIPDSECMHADCAGKSLPGPFEACGGKVVSATATATTMRNEDEVECCQACAAQYVATVCTPLLNLPDVGADLKRCEPQLPPSIYGQYGYEDPYDNYGSYSLMAAGRQLVARHATAASTLLGASAMVALVALVVVRRRRNAAAQRPMAVDDAYYPLLH